MVNSICIDLFDDNPPKLEVAAVETPTVLGRRRTRLALQAGELWIPESTNGVPLRVHFLDGAATLHSEVMQIAAEWSKYANLKFERSADRPHIRVTFQGSGNASRIGRSSLRKRFAASPDVFREASMILAGAVTASDDMKRRFVLHEFGHALGCIHEHASPAATIPWNEAAVLAYYQNEIWPPWSEAKVRANIFARYGADMTQFTAFDRASIMLYPLLAEHVRDPAFVVGWNRELSPRDKDYIAAIYPFPADASHRGARP